MASVGLGLSGSTPGHAGWWPGTFDSESRCLTSEGKEARLNGGENPDQVKVLGPFK